ncbi:TPA: right-handed parallel beta-helix repeat-containing protein [Enterobacter hormaechei]
MSSGCGDVLSLQDLQTAKKHQTFEAEVITGKQGGVAGGADIDYATNPVTLQVQKTLPAVLRDSGFEPVSFDFTTGGTLTTTDRNKVVYDPVSMTWYSWSGALPKVVPAGTNPLLDANWKPQTDPDLRDELAAQDGEKLLGDALTVVALRNIEPSFDKQRITLREYATGTRYGGGQLRAVLDGSAYTDNGVTVFKTPGGSAWVRVNADVVTSFMAGAVPDNGVTDNTAAINRFLLAGKNLMMGDGNFGHSGQIVLQSGINLNLSGATIKPSSTLLTAAWRGDNLTDVKITGGVFEGTGLDNTTGNGQLLLLVSCQRCIVDGSTFTKSPNDGLRFITSTRCIASNVISYNNLSVGIQDRDGDYNSIISCKCSGNGNTGVASSTRGRGILTWRSFGTKIIGCDAFNNTEYGIRAYSQTGDSRGSTQILISDCHAGDNTKIDIYVYNEIGSLAEILISNPMIRRTTQPEGTMIALQGTRVSCNGGSLAKSGDRLSVPCFSLFQTDSAAVRDVTVGNVGQLFSFSTANNSLITGLIANCSTVCGSAAGNGTMYKGNSFIHGGSGTSDVAIDAGTDPCSIVSNVFAGFWRNISWNSQKMTISGNESSGTTELSMRMFGDGIGNLYMGPNRWDTASNPALLASIQKQGGPSATPVWYADAAPTSTALTNPVGSRVLKATPVVGQPKGWLCTVSGAPGTWVSEGNL